MLLKYNCGSPVKLAAPCYRTCGYIQPLTSSVVEHSRLQYQTSVVAASGFSCVLDTLSPWVFLHTADFDTKVQTSR